MHVDNRQSDIDPTIEFVERCDIMDLGVRIGYLMSDVSRLHRAYFNDAMRPHGLTPSQWWVLAQLARRPGQPISQVELARSLDRGKAALGGLLDRMEANGYVVREASQNDRRVNLISPSALGLEMTETMRKIGDALNLEIFSVLSSEDVAALERTLTLLKRNILNLPRKDPGPEQEAMHPPVNG